MKLVNHLTLWLTICFLFILTGWSVVYFVMQMNEIYHDLDEGLENLRQEFVLKANKSAEFTEDMMKHNPLNIRVSEISYADAKDVRDTYMTSKIYFQTEEEEEEVRMLTTAFYSEPNGKYYELKIFTSNVEIEDIVKNMFFLLISLWLVLILSMVFLGRFIFKKSNRPFFELLDKLKGFHLDNKQMFELPKTSIYEFSELNKSIKNLLEENLKVYAEQKNFIENASHELQTPLAITINKLELMMSKDGLNRQQLEEMNQILSELNRMRRMNSNLLLLSKIYNNQFFDNELVDISLVVDEVVAYFSDLIDYKELQLDIKREGQLTMRMNPDLAHIMITNLVKNAIAHNVLGGRLQIVLTDTYISISNDGQPLNPDIDIFQRYVSSTENKQSSGLGLSIVKSITDLYKINITYTYDNWYVITVHA